MAIRVSSRFPYAPMGDVVPHVEQFTAKFPYGVLSSGTRRYVVPTPEQRAAMGEAFRQVLKGNPHEAQKLITAAGISYRVLVRFSSGIGRIGRFLIVVREAPDATGKAPQHWGRYYFSPEGRSAVSVQVPHPRSDFHSEHMGAEAFRRLDAHCLFVAGTGRYVNNAEEKSPSEADVAHRADSVFHELHRVTADLQGGTFLQFHGFSEAVHGKVLGKGTNAVITGGPAGATPRARAVASVLHGRVFAGTPLAAVTTTSAPLTGTTNEQGKLCRDEGCDFLHLELGDSLRDDRERCLEVARAVAEAVRETGEGRDRATGLLPALGFDRMAYPGLSVREDPAPPDGDLDLVVHPDGAVRLTDWDDPAYRIKDQDDLMRQWAAASPFSFCGYYLEAGPGQPPVPGYPQPWFTAETPRWRGRRARLVEMGWKLLPIYFGLQKNGGEARLDRATGQAHALQAHEIARGEGFPTGTVIYLDVEDGTPLWTVGDVAGRTDGMWEYVDGWLGWFGGSGNAAGYLPGVYCSHLVAESIRRLPGGGTRSEVDYWVFNAACSPAGEPGARSPGCTVRMKRRPHPSESGVPYASVWQYAKSSGDPTLRDPDANDCPESDGSGSGYQPADAEDPDGAQCVVGPFGVTLRYSAEVDLNLRAAPRTAEPDPAPGKKPPSPGWGRRLLAALLAAGALIRIALVGRRRTDRDRAAER